MFFLVPHSSRSNGLLNGHRINTRLNRVKKSIYRVYATLVLTNAAFLYEKLATGQSRLKHQTRVVPWGSHLYMFYIIPKGSRHLSSRLAKKVQVNLNRSAGMTRLTQSPAKLTPFVKTVKQLVS